MKQKEKIIEISKEINKEIEKIKTEEVNVLELLNIENDIRVINDNLFQFNNDVENKNIILIDSLNILNYYAYYEKNVIAKKSLKMIKKTILNHLQNINNEFEINIINTIYIVILNKLEKRKKEIYKIDIKFNNNEETKEAILMFLKINSLLDENIIINKYYKDEIIELINKYKRLNKEFLKISNKYYKKYEL